VSGIHRVSPSDWKSMLTVDFFCSLDLALKSALERRRAFRFITNIARDHEGCLALWRAAEKGDRPRGSTASGASLCDIFASRR
jgi:hypothetical protein